jgi:hypothetical protein
MKLMSDYTKQYWNLKDDHTDYCQRTLNRETSASRISALNEYISLEARGSVVGWGAMLQAGRSRVQVPLRSLDFFQLT